MPDSQQPSPSMAARSPSFSPAFAVVASAVVALGLLLERPHAHAVFAQARVFFGDPDDYMQTYRAERIATHGAVRIRHMPQINAPAGAELHWTAPMDYLLAGAAVVFGPLVHHEDPTGAVAAWVPACLGVLYVVCMMGLMRRGFGWGPAVLAGLMVVLTPAFHRVFQVGHPDHHCLLELLLLVALGPWFVRPRPDGSPGEPTAAAAFLSGVATGLAVWVAAQAMFLWLALILGLSYACLFGPPGPRRRYAELRLMWNGSTAAVVVAGFFIENWPDLYAVGIDKISIVHVACVAIGFLAPRRPAVSPRTSSRSRSRAPAAGRDATLRQQAQTTRHVALLAAVAAFIALMAVSQSRTFQHVSRPEFYRWSEHIAELQPLYARTATDWSIHPMHERLGFLPYALPVLLLFFLLSERVPRPLKCTLGLLAPTILILTILQRRWLDQINLAVTPVVVIGMWALIQALSGGGRAGSIRVRFISAAAVLAILLHPSIRHVASLTKEQALLANAYQQRTDFVAQQIVAHEATQPSPNPRRRAILCEDGEGPMLLYCTGLPVVATPYHRALDGLVEAARFYAERDPLRARAQLDRLGVRYVVMPPWGDEQLMHFEQIAFGELRSFDPPTETINRFGRILRTLHVRPGEVSQTMACRLVMELAGEVIPGVERIAEIDEGAKTPDGRPFKTGLLYVVHDLRTTTQPASAPASAP